MKNVLLTGLDWDDLIRQKKLLKANKAMCVGDTGVQWIGECEVNGKMTWILIYRATS